ncbi:MAG: hypothetical protein AAFN40_00405 [Cyanobacteria bacterium J06560_6]
MLSNLLCSESRSQRHSHITSLPITFYPRKRESFWHLVTSVVLMFGGYLGWEENTLMSVFCMAFFGLCATIFIRRLCDFSAHLRLDYDGFTMCSMNRKRRIRWQMIDHVYPTTVRGYQTVGWSFIPEFQSQTINAQWRRSFIGIDEIMPTHYGPTSQKLATLMNDLCQAYRIAHHYAGDR